MVDKFSASIIMFAFLLGALSTPAFGISVGFVSSGGSSSVSASGSYHLDTSTTLQSSSVLSGGVIQQSQRASGTGHNTLEQEIKGDRYSIGSGISSSGALCASSTSAASSDSGSQSQSVSGSGESTVGQAITGDGYAVHNSIISSGMLSSSSSSSASAGSGGLTQQVAGEGDMALSLQGSKTSELAGQEASVTGGAISTAQTLSAGDSVSSAQDTTIYGQSGSVVSGALSNKNVMAAEGSFNGAGNFNAKFSSSASDRANVDGEASMDGTSWINKNTFQSIASDNKAMGMEAIRGVGAGVGTFDAKVLNFEVGGKDGVPVSQSSLQTNGGSYSSYVLTGYRLNQNNPNLQLYYDPARQPTGLDQNSASSAIAAATQTWNSAVAEPLFVNTNTVKVDSNIHAGDPNNPTNDGLNVHGWWPLGGNYLGLTMWYSNGQKVGNYYSITQADTWYASDKTWSTSASTPSGKFDLQTVALHELGHTIGLGDLYNLPSSDPRKNDFAQIMNSYDSPQRILGNGDITGAQTLYGIPSRPDGAVPIYRMYSPYVMDHFYTTNFNEYTTGAVKVGYSQEGTLGYLYQTNVPGTVPVYRMYNPYVTDHFYTTSYDEYTTGAVNVGYSQEGILGYLYLNSGTTGTSPVYRMYSPYVTDHLYTTSYNEYTTSAVNVGYSQEGTLGYLFLS
jgi:hypothetical protein